MDFRDPLRFSWAAAACVALYGVGSWIVVNGIWVELPVLVNQLPEGWELPAYLSIIIQIANVGPLLYVPLTKLCRVRSRRVFARCLQPPERLANYTILTFGLLSCILLAHFWHVVVPLPGLSGDNHSIGLLILSLCAAILDCTSSVTFTAYLTGLPETYFGALALGEAFSDLFPSSIALIQGVGGTPTCVNSTVNGTSTLIPQYPPPRFGVLGFMYCLSSLLAVSLVAFLLLDISPRGFGRAVTRHYLSSFNPKIKQQENTEYHYTETWNATHRSSDDPLGSQSNPLPSGKAEIAVHIDDLPLEAAPLFRFKGIDLCTTEYFLPLILLGYSSLLTNGFLPAFQSYSSASYDSLTYHLAVTLSGLVCALLTVVVTYMVNRRKVLQRTSSSRSFAKSAMDETDWASAAYVRRAQFLWLLMAALASCPAAYVVFLASRSPNPPQLSGLGPVLAVVAWILVRSGFSALRTWLWLHLSSRSHRPMALRLAGLATQLGAVLGAIASYLMVVHFQLFKSKSFC